MSPTISQGEMVLVDACEAERLEVLAGRIYLVILPDGTTALKRLVLSADDERPEAGLPLRQHRRLPAVRICPGSGKEALSRTCWGACGGQGKSLTDRRGGEMVTANYTGKEAAYIKNELLRAYLEPLFMIIGQREPRISYIDCFSGPWQKGRQDATILQLPSLWALWRSAIMICRKNSGKTFSFAALFIERDKESFGRLENFLKSESWGGVDAFCFKGDFYNLREEILSWCGNRDLSFFFVDTTVLRHMAISTLRPLLGRPSSEFLISSML